MARKIVVILSAVGLGLVSFTAGVFYKPATPCQKLKGKIEVANQFCVQMSKDFAEEVCSQQTDDPKLLQVCESLMAPRVYINCLSRVGIEKMRTQEETFCSLKVGALSP